MITRTDLEVQRTIEKIKKRMQVRAKLLSEKRNEAVKAGYTEALAVLEQKRLELEPIAEHCVSVQARCIAWLAVDYLQGECSAKVLLGVPIKGESKQ